MVLFLHNLALWFLQKMDALYRQLCKKYPDMATKSEKKLTDLKENWERLKDLASARSVALHVYVFLSACHFAGH